MIDEKTAARYLRLDEEDGNLTLCYLAAVRYIENAVGVSPETMDDPEMDMLLCQLTGEFYENRSYLSEKEPRPGWANAGLVLHLQGKYDKEDAEGGGR